MNPKRSFENVYAIALNPYDRSHYLAYHDAGSLKYENYRLSHKACKHFFST